MTDAGQSLTRGGIVICFHGRLVRLHSRTGILRVTVTTTLGRFVLHSDGKIERGKLLKESLHGRYTSRRASE